LGGCQRPSPPPSLAFSSIQACRAVGGCLHSSVGRSACPPRRSHFSSGGGSAPATGARPRRRLLRVLGMPKPDWRKKTAWRLDEAEQRLDAIHGTDRQRSRLRDTEGEPSAALRRFSPRLAYPNFPTGVPQSAEEEMQALRLGHTIPTNFEPQRHLLFVAGRPVMATMWSNKWGSEMRGHMFSH